MNKSQAAWFAILLVGCGQAAPSQKAPSTAAPVVVTQRNFEPVYRSAKGIQGATASGVTYLKFVELMQGLATEIGIAKDHTLNEADKKLLALYEEAFSHYQLSAALWKMKIEANDTMWRGEIPFDFAGGKGADSDAVKAIGLYHLPIADRTTEYTGKKYRTIPGDSVQRAWAAADAVLKKATDLYYGR